MDNWVENFLMLPRVKRKKVKLGEKGYQKKKYRKQRRLTKEQVIMFLVEHRIKTNTALMLHKDNPNAPGYYHIRKFYPEQYGMSSWDMARKEIFGIGKSKPFEPSPMAVVKAIQHCRITSITKYMQHRKKNSYLFPSKHYLYREFGSFTNLMRIVDSLDPQSIVTRYIRLKYKLQRWPTKKECKEHAVEIGELKMSMSELKWTVRLLENPMGFIKRTIR